MRWPGCCTAPWRCDGPSAKAHAGGLLGAAEAAKALPDVMQQLAAEGALPVLATPRVFADLIARETPRWRKVVRAGNVKAD